MVNKFKKKNIYILCKKNMSVRKRQNNIENHKNKSYLSSDPTVGEVNSRSQGLTRLNILNKTTVGA